MGTEIISRYFCKGSMCSEKWQGTHSLRTALTRVKYCFLWTGRLAFTPIPPFQSPYSLVPALFTTPSSQCHRLSASWAPSLSASRSQVTDCWSFCSFFSDSLVTLRGKMKSISTHPASKTYLWDNPTLSSHNIVFSHFIPRSQLPHLLVKVLLPLIWAQPHLPQFSGPPVISQLPPWPHLSLSQTI